MIKESQEQIALETEISKSLLLITDHIKSLVSLSAFKQDMWSEEHSKTTCEFIAASGRRRLICYLDATEFNPLFFVSTTLPTLKITELQYFIIDSDEPLPSLVEFESKLQIGTIEGNLMESFLRLMGNVFVPQFVDNEAWPDSVKKDFIGQLHKFMAALTVFIL